MHVTTVLVDMFCIFCTDFLVIIAEITIPANSWLIGNYEYFGFYRTNYDRGMWTRLIQQLKRDHTVSINAIHV